MSGFGGGPKKHYEDQADLERQIDEVYRRSRQQQAALQGGQQSGGNGLPPPPPGAFSGASLGGPHGGGRGPPHLQHGHGPPHPHGGRGPPPPHGHPHDHAYAAAHHLSMLGASDAAAAAAAAAAASPYYARHQAAAAAAAGHQHLHSAHSTPHHHHHHHPSPHLQQHVHPGTPVGGGSVVGTPYGASRPSPYLQQQQQQQQQEAGSLTQLYVSHQQQQQHKESMRKASLGSYPPPPGYGPQPPPPPSASPKGSTNNSSPEDRYGSGGSGERGTAERPGGAGGGAHSHLPTPKNLAAAAAAATSPLGSAASVAAAAAKAGVDPQAAQEIAIMQEAFNRERKNNRRNQHSASNSAFATPNSDGARQTLPSPSSQHNQQNQPPATPSMSVGTNAHPGSGGSASANNNNNPNQTTPATPSPRTPTSSSSINSNGNNSTGGKTSSGGSGSHIPIAPGSAVSASTEKPMLTFPSRALRLPPPTKTDSGGKKKETAIMGKDDDGKLVVEDHGMTWYMGSVPLGVDDDKYWLSELQVYLRSYFAEAFAATEEDIAAPMHGRNKPIALGQVGIRCMHCKSDNPAERGQQATSYPSLISGIYNSVQQMLRLHLDCCLTMPNEVRTKIEHLKLSCSSRGGRKQYWVDSAKRLGLVDTPHGIHFCRDPTGPLPPLTGPSVNSKENRKKKIPPQSSQTKPKKIKQQPVKHEEESTGGFEEESTGGGPGGGDGSVSAALDFGPPPPLTSSNAVEAAPPPETEPSTEEKEKENEKPILPPVDSRPLVFPEDKHLISDYLYLTLEQMAPCTLTEADRVGCYKARKVGFPGLACKHCVGQAGCGRYFPASEASLSQTTTSQTIMNHVRNCRRCPIEIRENLEIMKRNRMGPDGKRSEKPKHGGRKVFFHRLWCRIQNIPFEEGKAETKESKRRKKKGSNSGGSGGASGEKKKRRQNEDGDDMDETDEDDHEDRDGEEDETMSDSEHDSDSEEGSMVSDEGKPKSKIKVNVTAVEPPKKKGPTPWVEGCVRLCKTDDPHWLSELESYARSDLVEVFSLGKDNELDGYPGRKEPVEGQVGIRCVFCKNLDPSDRPNGCVAFPDTLSAIHTKVTDMIRLHFPGCPAMPNDARESFKSLRGFGAKVSSDDSQQYWVDAARDIGLANVPPAGPRAVGAWGITFRRDPLQPSPADELDLEATNHDNSSFSKNSLVKAEDRGLCTDQVLLLLRQVRPCRFKKSDRRAGPGSRGRDRVMGFPGLCCMHCTGRNTLGRYFPVSAKNLTDSTANSLQAHIASCTRCPEPIKASLAFLGHRSILQKAELSGSWKKAFFQKVWSRLHIEREWTSKDDEEGDGEGGGINYSDIEEEAEEEHHHLHHPEEHHEQPEVEEMAVEEDEVKEEKEDEEEEEGTRVVEAEATSHEDEIANEDPAADGSENSDQEKEDLGHMAALIKAAAIWLTEQDVATETSKAAARSRGRASSTTSAPAITVPVAKRPSPVSPTRGSRSASTGLTTKRRRVHF